MVLDDKQHVTMTAAILGKPGLGTSLEALDVRYRGPKLDGAELAAFLSPLAAAAKLRSLDLVGTGFGMPAKVGLLSSLTQLANLSIDCTEPVTAEMRVVLKPLNCLSEIHIRRILVL